MKAHVAAEKLSGYLLNLDHPDGAAKARFFLAGGFSPDRPDQLGEAPRAHFETNPPSDIYLDRWGNIRVEVIAPMSVPDDRTPLIVSAWRIEGKVRRHGIPARLITAYPAE